MKDKDKTERQLLNKPAETRRQVSEPKKSKDGLGGAEESLEERKELLSLIFDDGVKFSVLGK